MPNTGLNLRLVDDNGDGFSIILKKIKNPLFYFTGPISTKFGTKHPWVDGIQILKNKGPHPSSWGDENKLTKFNNLLHNHWANFNQIWHKASLGEGDSRFYK